MVVKGKKQKDYSKLKFILIFLASLISAIPFIVSKYFIDNPIIFVLIESIWVFSVFVLVYKLVKEDYKKVFLTFSFWYLTTRILLENLFYVVDKLSIVYFFFTGFFWIYLITRGVKKEDKMYWFLWFIVGTCINLGITLLYTI